MRSAFKPPGLVLGQARSSDHVAGDRRGSRAFHVSRGGLPNADGIRKTTRTQTSALRIVMAETGDHAAHDGTWDRHGDHGHVRVGMKSEYGLGRAPAKKTTRLFEQLAGDPPESRQEVRQRRPESEGRASSTRRPDQR